jgi:hypothetical protein
MPKLDCTTRMTGCRHQWDRGCFPGSRSSSHWVGMGGWWVGSGALRSAHDLVSIRLPACQPSRHALLIPQALACSADGSCSVLPVVLCAVLGSIVFMLDTIELSMRLGEAKGELHVLCLPGSCARHC